MKNKRERGRKYGVPDLQLNGFVIDGDHPGPEFNPDGKIMYRLKPFVGELKEEA